MCTLLCSDERLNAILPVHDHEIFFYWFMTSVSLFGDTVFCVPVVHVFGEICTWVFCSFWCPCGWNCSLNFSFWCFIVGIVKFNWFLCVVFILCSFTKFLCYNSLFWWFGEKLEPENPTLSIITQVICNTQGIMAPNIVFPWCLLVMCGWVCASVVSNSLLPYGL